MPLVKSSLSLGAVSHLSEYAFGSTVYPGTFLFHRDSKQNVQVLQLRNWAMALTFTSSVIGVLLKGVNYGRGDVYEQAIQKNHIHGGVFNDYGVGACLLCGAHGERGTE
jgi:hypothetical protein